MKYVILGLGFLLLASCVSCSMGSSKDANLVDDIADECDHGLKKAIVTQDDDDKSVTVECAGYGL